MVALVPTPPSAQPMSHWGIAGSVAPTWQVPTELENVFGGTVDVKRVESWHPSADRRPRARDRTPAF